jgi:sugar phosphate permease
MNDPSQSDSNYRWIILAVLTVIQTGASIAALSFGPLAPFLQEALNINRAQVGLCISFLYLGSVLVSIPSGRLADRIGVRRMLLIGPTLMAFFFFAISQTPSYQTICLMVMGAGMGYGVINPSTAKAIIYWFSATGRATAIGFKQAGVPAGAAIAAVLLPALALSYGLRTAICIVGIFVLVLTFLCYLLNRDFPTTPSLMYEKKNEKKGFRDVIRNRPILLLSLANVIWSAIQLSLSTYLVLYFTEKLVLSVMLAGTYLAVAQACAGVGRVIWGIISDRLFGGKRKIVLVIIGIITTIATVAMATLNTNTPGWVVVITVVLLGLSVLGRHGVSITFVAELGGKELAGTATGVQITISYMGIVLGPPIFGHIVDLTNSYSLAWFTFGLASALATGILHMV